MDGIHDLGGKLGYGSVDVNEPEAPFHAEFEGRAWALARLVRAPTINIDWWRHIRELIDKDDYLKRPYFESWAQTDMAAYIDAEIFSMNELMTGIPTNVENAPKPVSAAEVLEVNKTMAVRFDKKSEEKPKFEIGQQITTKSSGHSGHTRLPEYARAKTGTIIATNGAHCFPDDGALGEKKFEHMYTVSFMATELWGAKVNPKDSVSLELWESYFD